MKKAYSCRPIFIFLAYLTCSLVLESCSDDRLLLADDATSAVMKKHNEIALRTGEVIPVNSENPYDSVGRIYNELFETYYATENLPQSISAIASRVEFLANANSEFSTLKTVNYHVVSTERVEYIISRSDTIVSEIIKDSDMTDSAKLSLDTFINSLLVLSAKEDSVEVLYNFVVSYEIEVLSNSMLTERDKQIILTTTSIARYSTYVANRRPKKNTDPDWIIFVGNIIGGTDGANYEQAEAITTALVTGIAQNISKS